MTQRSRIVAVGTALAAGLVLLSACTKDKPTAVFRDAGVPTGGLQLVAFDSCDDALAKLRQAAKRYVGPYGFGGSGGAALAEGTVPRDAAGAPAAAAPDQKSTSGSGNATKGREPSYSGTNTHEAGVDEPDLVKTDGHRIVTISQGVLRVVDVPTRRVTGRLDLRTSVQDPTQWTDSDLLLAGDRALVLLRGQYYYGFRGGMEPGPVEDVAPPPTNPKNPAVVGPRLLLVDLSSGVPELTGSYTVDGELVDARQVGAIARVVVRSGPRLVFPYDGTKKQTDAQRQAANRATIDKAGIDTWLPRYEVTSEGRTTRGKVSCSSVKRPATYTGTSLVTVLSFDLGKDDGTLGSGDPVTVVADGNTVYSNGPSLYVANDQQWWEPMPADAAPGGKPATFPEERTELYKFDTSRPGQPRYLAAGSVPGFLLNQYSMSEWDGQLRVATTSGQNWGRSTKSESAVYVLHQRGKELVQTGKVGGLGKGEKIYAVRFVGPVGYVVTFRQTDPLYTVDLRNPAAPKVIGALKITGFSAYLHPVNDTRLIGIGQDATDQGRVRGTQVSLFDVTNLADPQRIDQYQVKYGHSEAEFDPHAFLYWPETGLLVVPVNVYSGGQPEGGALVLKVSANGLTEIGTVSHPLSQNGFTKFPGQIRRALIIDDVLWTVSSAGLKANDATTLEPLTWIAF
ncbi:MAG TPA: beta-propeller domain-containing protein [Micromonosporaceae bacterium]|jgi:hypothetical protein|nr:beta-propeller domain-containing protein [Micromonosporaceae bacterium]